MLFHSRIINATGSGQVIENERTQPKHPEWNTEAEGRLSLTIDLPAEEAIYHKKML